MTGLATGAAALAATTLLPNSSKAAEAGALAAPERVAGGGRHAVWVWAFSEDGRNPETVRSVLAANNLDVIFKTHDGAEWTTRADGLGVGGPEDVRKWADFFESAGVGFHAWSVVRGVNTAREAEMTAQALDNGARSMYFDLETPEGRFYWHGSNQDAVIFGQQVRALKPDATLIVAPDGRPWKVKEVPVAEFAGFCDGIAPQLYWELFDSPANYKLLADYGYHAGPEGMTPELILNSANGALAKFGRPILPIGGGAAKLDEWHRFVNHAYSLGMPSVSVWRYGTSGAGVMPALQTLPPPQPAPPVDVVAPAAAPAAPAAAAPAAAAPAVTATPQPAQAVQADTAMAPEKDKEKLEKLTAKVREPRSDNRLSDDWRSLGSERSKR